MSWSDVQSFFLLTPSAMKIGFDHISTLQMGWVKPFKTSMDPAEATATTRQLGISSYLLWYRDD